MHVDCYSHERISRLPATHWRSSPRALCLLVPELAPRARAWSEAAEHAAGFGEPIEAPGFPRVRRVRPARAGLHLGADPTHLLAWLRACVAGPRGLQLRLDRLPLADDGLRLSPDLDISLDEQRYLLQLWSLGDGMTHFERLGLAPTDDPAELRRAYLATCQRLHPDRYYGKRIGGFEALLVDLFHRARAAHVVLSDPRRCASYLAQLTSGRAPEPAPRPAAHTSASLYAAAAAR
jgi:hypothetical protein